MGLLKRAGDSLADLDKAHSQVETRGMHVGLKLQSRV